MLLPLACAYINLDVGIVQLLSLVVDSRFTVILRWRKKSYSDIESLVYRRGAKGEKRGVKTGGNRCSFARAFAAFQVQLMNNRYKQVISDTDVN